MKRTSNIKIKSGKLSHTHPDIESDVTEPIILKNTLNSSNIEKIYSPEEIEKLRFIQPEYKLDMGFWDNRGYIVKIKGKRMGIKGLFLEDYDKDDNLNKAETPLHLVEFDNDWFEKETLFPTSKLFNRQGDYSRYIEGSYTNALNSDWELFYIQGLMGDDIVFYSLQEDKEYWFVPVKKSYVQYLIQKYKDRSVVFAVNSEQIKNKIETNENQKKEDWQNINLDIDAALVVRETKEVIATVRLAMYYPELYELKDPAHVGKIANNNIIEVFKKNIQRLLK